VKKRGKEEEEPYKRKLDINVVVADSGRSSETHRHPVESELWSVLPVSRIGKQDNANIRSRVYACKRFQQAEISASTREGHVELYVQPRRSSASIAGYKATFSSLASPGPCGAAPASSTASSRSPQDTISTCGNGKRQQQRSKRLTRKWGTNRRCF
jgi:hypothetical protein